MGLVAVTHYSVVVRLSDYFSAIILTIFSLAGPIFAGHHAVDNIEKIRRHHLVLSRLCALATSLLAGAIIVMGPMFIHLWLGSEFSDIYMATAIVSAGLMWALIQTPSRDVLGAMYRHPFDAYTTLAEAAANIALSVILVRPFGFVGIAIATAATMTVSKLVILPIYVCRCIGQDPYVYYRTILVAVGVVAAGHVPLALIMPHVPISWLAFFGLGATYYAVLTPLAAFITLSAGERAMMFRMLRKPQ
jgi:O-antigen/teichoic acid export membrane protein